jgi:dynein heavy chain
MNKQLAEWDVVIAQIKPWRETGTFTVSGVSIEEIQQLLDDQMVKTQTMKGSPYAKTFEKKIADWEDWLSYTFNLTNHWK